MSMTPEQLDAIEARAARQDVPALVAEIRRLQPITVGDRVITTGGETGVVVATEKAAEPVEVELDTGIISLLYTYQLSKLEGTR